METAEAMAGTADPAVAYRKLVGLRNAVSAVEAEVSALTTRREAWFAVHFHAVTSHRFELHSDELFTLARRAAVAPATVAPGDLAGGTAAAQAVLGALGLALVDVTPEDEADTWTTADAEDIARLQADVEHGQLPLGVFYRVPRPCTVGFYKTAKDGRLALERVERYWLLDRLCRIGSIPLDIDRSHFPGKGSATASIEFSAAGTPETIAISEQSGLAEVLTALAGAPGKLSAGLTSAKTSLETLSTLHGSRTQREIAALEDRKKVLETEVALRPLEADAGKTQTLQELKDRLDRLKTEKDIGDLEHPAAPAETAQRDADAKAALARLQVELKTAQAEAALAGFGGAAS